MHVPSFEGGRLRRRFVFGRYRAAVLSDLRSLGKTEYEYAMVVAEEPDAKLRLIFTSERNRMYGKSMPDGEPLGASHFLCVSVGDEHRNCGSSNDWADLESFSQKALELAQELLGVSGGVVEVRRRPWWRFWRSV